MRFYLLFFIVPFICVASSCNNNKEEIDFDANNCKRIPAFVQTQGFDQKRSSFRTSDKKRMGLLLVESDAPADLNVLPTKIYQHPSWAKAGWLGQIMIDDQGNIFTAPAPFINVLNNPVENQNTIYKVDPASAEMNEFLRLPITDSSSQNAYGIIAMAFLCETGTLYVSSVAGSDRQHERGAIYAIDTKEKKIIDRITAVDAMGMGISYITGERKLYFGNGRNSDVNTIALDKNGKFIGKSEFAFSLQGLGPRGDDKVRRINADRSGNLNVVGFEFNYNLIAPGENQEFIYKAMYIVDDKKWQVSSTSNQ